MTVVILVVLFLRSFQTPISPVIEKKLLDIQMSISLFLGE